MNTIRHLVVTALFAASGAAFAQGPLEGPAPATGSTLTRAEVRAQLAAAAADGTLMRTDADYYRVMPASHQRSRAEVVAETLAAAERGELRALNGEVGDAAAFAHPGRQARIARALAQVKPAS